MNSTKKKAKMNLITEFSVYADKYILKDFEGKFGIIKTLLIIIWFKYL